MKYAASLVKLHIDERLKALRTDALARGIPVTDEETLNYLLLMLSASRPRRILEIGTAVGLSAVAMLLRCPAAHVTTIELEVSVIWKQNKILNGSAFLPALPAI